MKSLNSATSVSAHSDDHKSLKRRTDDGVVYGWAGLVARKEEAEAQ